MKIWHVGASSSPGRVDGVSRTVWLLSREQARLGHDVTLVFDTPADGAAIELARDAGLKLLSIDATPVTYPQEVQKLLEGEHRPQIVHMHSVFIVRQATMARILSDYQIPYVITPHGGLAPQVLRRGVIKKSIYAWLRERPRFMGASAVALVTPAEERPVRSFIPDYHRPVRWMPNPVDVEKLDTHTWQAPLADQTPRVVFLGRFDVLVKGIDIFIEIARLLPEMQFDLYGTEDPKTLEWLNRIRQNLPANVTFHNPIFGPAKAQMLAGATLYLQPSRWEGFPVSVAECMYLGVPSAVADTLDLAQLFYQHNLGLVLPLDPPRAAQQIRAAISDPARLQEWSQRGRQFALKHFHPTAAAKSHIKLYQEVIDSRARAAAHDDIALRYQSVARGELRRNGHIARDRPALMPAELRGVLKTNVSRMFARSRQVLGTNGVARTVVLCYHSVNTNQADLAIDPAVLRTQLAMLKEFGFEFMNFGDLVYRVMRWGRPRGNIACITFDDGYEDNLNIAAPVLLDMHIPATIFVTSGLMARDQSIIDSFQNLTRYPTTYLSVRQVAQLAQAGFEIGAHTHSHPNMAKLSVERARLEVTQSKAMLEDATGRRVRSFAYPFGKRNIHYTTATVGVVRESGYCGAAAVAFRSMTSRSAIHLFEVPRFFVTRSDTPSQFRQKVEGHFDWLGSIQESTPAWLKALVSPEDQY